MIAHADVVVVVDEYYWKIEKKEGSMHNINSIPSLLFFFYMYAHFFLKCHCTAMLLFTQEAPSSSSLCIMSIIYTILRIIVNIQTFKWTIFYIHTLYSMIHTFTLIQKHTCIQMLNNKIPFCRATTTQYFINFKASISHTFIYKKGSRKGEEETLT